VSTKLNLDLPQDDYSISEYQNKCEAITEWAAENPRRNFDTSFVESMYDRISDGGLLSPNQRAAIDRIISSFEIEF
jgi:hypothetical protein